MIGRILTILVIAPLLVNVCACLWMAGNSWWRQRRFLNWLLSHVGLRPVLILYTEGNHYRLGPSLPSDDGPASCRCHRQNRSSGRRRGTNPWRVCLRSVCRITLPLSIPGLAVGCTLVFSLTASSFILPALLGGNFTKMLGTLVEEQILPVFDSPFGEAIRRSWSSS